MNREFCTSYQVDFKSHLFTNNLRKLEATKRYNTEKFSNSEVCQSLFSKSENFWRILNLNDVIRRFCDIMILT